MSTLPVYLLGAQSVTLKRLSEVAANNIANGQTDGFKRDSALVSEFKARLSGAETVSYAIDGPQFLDMTQGSLKRTGNSYTVALMGPGFFTLEGDVYTRSGSLLQNTDGELVNPEGVRFLSAGGGPIVVPPGADIFISKDGRISTSQGEIAQLGVVSFDDETKLEKRGYNLYATDQEAQPMESPQVVQGFLEQSNVQPAKELVNLMQYTAAYQQDMNLMVQSYEMEEGLVSKLLRV